MKLFNKLNKKGQLGGLSDNILAFVFIGVTAGVGVLILNALMTNSSVTNVDAVNAINASIVSIGTMTGFFSILGIVIVAAAILSAILIFRRS